MGAQSCKEMVLLYVSLSLMATTTENMIPESEARIACQYHTLVRLYGDFGNVS